MLQFLPLDLSAKPIVSSFIRKFECQLMNYSFETLFLYRDVFRVHFTIFDNFLILKLTQNQEEYFMFPMGEGNLPTILNIIAKETLDNHKRLCFCQFCNDMAPLLVQWAEDYGNETGSKYIIHSIRNQYEYIYSAKQLALLGGHLLKPKRNQINFFTKNNIWSSMSITRENIEQVKQFNDLWEEQKISEDNFSLTNENIAIQEAFTHFFDLNLQGILLQIENKIVAFSIGFPLNEDTFLILFEKADRNFKGAYTMINRLFAQEISKKYTYINRGEDAGAEGLRKAKLSYLPEYLIEVNELEIYQ